MSRWAATPLLVLVPLVWQSGYALARMATREARLSKVLAPGLALTAWLLAIHVIGLATHSFYAGLFAGTIIVAGLGAWSWRRISSGAGETETGPVFPWWTWIALLIAIAPIAGPELRWSEHDECLVATGHVNLPQQIQNGIYPPRYSTFPQFEIRYHYGVDLAAAVSSTLLGKLDMQPTVHLLAVALWAYTFLLLWIFGERLIGGTLAGPVTAFGVLFAGGAPYFCRSLKPLSLYLISDCGPGGTWITPPLISNFLQHPWSLGIPLTLMILLLLPFLQTERVNRWAWLAVSLLFAMLSFTQVVLFVCLLPTVVVAAAWSARADRRLRRFLVFSLWAIAILAAARLLHGFFTPGTEPKGSIEFHPYWKEATLGGWLAWNWDSMGLLLPFGIAGFFLLPRTATRLVLLVLAAGGLLARNLFRYSSSWDIVKFSMVSQIALALLSAALLARAIAHRRTRILGVAGLIACTFFGIGWSAALSLDLPALWFCKSLTPRPGPPDQAAMAFLQDHMREGEGVFLTQFRDAYAIYGGLATPSFDWGIDSHGFSRSLFDRRKQIIDHPPPEPGPYLDQYFHWILVRDGEPRLEADVARWAREGKAELAAEIPPLRIYRINSPDGSR